MLGLACLSWGLGQAVWTWYESMLGREVPFPSLADIGYLMFVPLVAGALLAFPSVPRRLSSRIRTVLDGLLIASALLFMSWMLVLGPLFQAGGDPLTLTIGLAYPAGDVVIIPNLAENLLDPAGVPNGMAHKMIIDATTPKPPDRRGDYGQVLDTPENTDAWRARLLPLIKALRTK